MEAVRLGIKLLILAIFLGYMMIWIMMPTNAFFKHWFPEIHARTDATYFGKEGTFMLIYTLPILFVASLGCLYLHLGNNNGQSCEVKNSKFASWKRPVLVKGPLGIVSWTELSFLIMFVALLIWSFVSYLHAMFANISKQAAAQGLKVWEDKLEMSGLLIGLVGNICLAFLFFPVSRGSSILQLLGLTSERSIKYHIWLGNAAMTLFTVHGLCYIIFWAKTDQISQMLKWGKISVSNLAGEIALLSGIGMWMTSFPRIRRKIFELFLYTHYLYIIFMVFYVFHVGFSYSCIIIPGFYLFLIDRFLRFLQSQQKVRLVSARILPCEALELNFSKSPGLRYNSTSMVFVKVPSISRLQWHPFTVTSNSNMDPEKLSVVIKSEGSWSRKLYQKLSSPSPIDRLQVSIEGPYGPASTHFTRHEKLVMVSGGSGLTPFISIIRELVCVANTATGRTRQVLLVCAFKKSEDLTMLDLILPNSGITLDISRLQLQIEAYVTREKEPTANNQKVLRTIWLKPDAADAPISSVLGPRSWLWLGAIISSSFVVFLLLIGILTRYYIYPIDHNSDMIYATTWRSAFNLLFVFVSIAMTATAAFFWNEKQQRKEKKQVQNMETATPRASPGSWLYNADRELERLPHQSFVEATKVHYGERPNLKKTLMDMEGFSLGVLVSGPRRMRQEVAEICASGLADNLHFESLSFTW
ncbi:ferric reduction oxidase 2-like [Mangifera indica]|uniref:ferric reduction oxidase 2-like n=1 Tax=Mangifera indica TaxID=29780 RepID=UPI001CFBFC5E|nr:ferric reduction oxidase 2-like [Mangifera indica]